MTKHNDRKKAIRARMAQTGEAYNAARRALDHERAEVAERDWWRHAVVRLTRDVTTDSPYVDRPTHHRAGSVLPLWQTGRKDRPITATQWTTSLDVDLMGFIPADAVEVVEVLEEMPPRLADPVEHAAGDATAPLSDRVMVHDHRQGVTRDVQTQVVRLHRGGGRPEPELLRLAADILEAGRAAGCRWLCVGRGQHAGGRR